MTTESSRPRRIGGDIALRERQLAELHAAAGVPDGLTHEQAVAYLAGIAGKLDAVTRLAVSWEPRAAQGVTLQRDYERGRCNAYTQAITELRLALKLPAR